MTPVRPNVVVLAGPNGAGKSTMASLLLPGALGVQEFVNADVIAQGLRHSTRKALRWPQGESC